MLLVSFLALCVSLTTGRVVENGQFIFVKGEESLEWPEKYTVKATKISLTANLVEDFVIWRTTDFSRLDSNQGVVKAFKKIDCEGEIEKYEVHPETDEEENVKSVCYDHTYDEEDTITGLDTLLPDLYDIDFEPTGYYIINNEDTVLFESNNNDGSHKLWASEYYDDGNNITAWMPVRYEVKEYNTMLGYLSNHEIWDFQEFSQDFDEDDLYDYEEYGCSTERAIKVAPDSEAVTKELMFINTENKHHVDHVFNSFKNKFSRTYAHEEEHALRRHIFRQNMRLISSINRKNLGYKLGVNHLADRTPEELKKGKSLLRRPAGKSGNVPFPYKKESLKELAEQLPTNVDLRVDGLVTPVIDQENCGSCWTYGTTASMEGALARSNGGRLIRLANQALVDCAWTFGASGCDGGTDISAYEWMMAYGLPTVAEYGSYKNADGICNIHNMTKLYPIKGYTDVTPFSSEALKVALFNHGPLSVSVEVTDQFQFYSRGIYYEKDCGPTNLNHEVTLVGYGEQYGELFWILKNSYGVNWGVDGFMHISARDNDCGVATEPTYVVL